MPTKYFDQYMHLDPLLTFISSSKCPPLIVVNYLDVVHAHCSVMLCIVVHRYFAFHAPAVIMPLHQHYLIEKRDILADLVDLLSGCLLILHSDLPHQLLLGKHHSLKVVSSRKTLLQLPVTV